MLFRLLLLLVIAGSLALFTLSNLQPLALTFLGMKAPALPLSWLILAAIAAGVATNILLQLVMTFSNYLAVQSLWIQTGGNNRRQASRQPNRQDATTRLAEAAASSYRTSIPRSAASSSEEDAVWKDWEGYEQPEPSASERRTSPTSQKTQPAQPLDDWETPTSDDWSIDQPKDIPSDRRTSPDLTEAETDAFYPPTEPSSPREFEKQQQPSRESRTGSVYSYSYRQSETTDTSSPKPPTEKVTKPDVARQEVVDADYRVIIPPYRPLDGTEPLPKQPPSNDEEENADDWF